jgi:hypothetical protein
MGFTGTWDVVSSPDFDYDYLSMDVEPYVTLRQDGDRVEGHYQVGLQTGYLDGRVEEGFNFFTFSFEGNDEMEEVHSSGEATLNGDHLTFELRYFLGDEYTFDCERQR